MPFPADADVLQVKLCSWCHGQLGMNVRYWTQIQHVGLGVDFDGIAGFFDQLFEALYKPLMTSDAEWLGVSVKRVRPGPASVAYVSQAFQGPGTGSAVPLPTQVCGLITLRSAFSGRTHRGRAYIPFPADDMANADGDCTAGYFNDLISLGAQMVGSLTVGTGGNTADLQAVVATAPTYITTALIDSEPRARFATQRKRGQFGQPNPKEIPR